MLWLLVACLSLAVPGNAQLYSFRYYGVEDGLTNLAVKVIFQDRRGFLWVGTEGGVFRFDGSQFQRYGPAQGLPTESIGKREFYGADAASVFVETSVTKSRSSALRMGCRRESG